MTRRSSFSGRRAALPAAAIAIALTFGLSACTSTEATTTALHASVVQIAERAAAGDHAGALAELALFERDLVEAVESGQVDAEREQRIRAAMELVRADLEAAEVPTTPAPGPEPTPDDAGDDAGDDGPGNSSDAPGKSDNKGKGDNKGNNKGDDR